MSDKKVKLTPVVVDVEIDPDQVHRVVRELKGVDQGSDFLMYLRGRMTAAALRAASLKDPSEALRAQGAYAELKSILDEITS